VEVHYNMFSEAFWRTKMALVQWMREV